MNIMQPYRKHEVLGWRAPILGATTKNLARNMASVNIQWQLAQRLAQAHEVACRFGSATYIQNEQCQVNGLSCIKKK